MTHLTKQFLKSFTWLALLSAIALFIHAWAFTRFNEDGGFYLKVAEDIAEGKLIWKEIALYYPPVAIYLFALIKRLIGEAHGFQYFISFIFFIHAINAFLVFKIGNLLTKNLNLSLFGTSFYLLSLYLHEGNHIVLEPFVVCFSLTAIFFSFKADKYLWIVGFFTVLAALSKQYGLALLLPVSCWIIFSSKDFYHSFKRLFLFGLGAAITSLFFIVYFVFVLQIEAQLILDMLSGSGYGNRWIMKFFWAIRDFVLRGNIFLLALPILFFTHRFFKDLRFLYLGLLALVFALPIWFKSYLHYFQLLIPFTSLLAVYTMHLLEKSPSKKILNTAYKYLIIASLILTTVLAIHRFWTQNRLNWDRKTEFEMAAELSEEITAKSPVILLSQEVWLYYLCDFESVDLARTGYTFHPMLPREELEYLLQKGHLVISRESVFDYKNYQHYKPLLKKYKFKLTKTTTHGLQIWRKSYLD